MSDDIFISYRRTDQPLARALVGALEAEGVSVWWDQEIEGGEDWREAIVRGLTGARALVILFSEECNASKQLKKELAIADTLDKEVIPVLIEDTTPKGHYLYELAARNWLQLHPNPESKIGDLAKRLARELGKTAPAAPAAPAESMVSAPEAMTQAPGAIESAPATQPAAPTRREAPVMDAKTVEKVVRATQAEKAAKKDRRDFLPFKWYEVLIAVLLGCLTGAATFNEQRDIQIAVPDGILATMAVLAVISALVFPFRYYFRRRRVWRAARYYALSNLVLAVGLAAISAVHGDMIDSTMGLAGNFAIFLIVWIGFLSVLAIGAFAIYGLLHFQRTMRSFNDNVEAI